MQTLTRKSRNILSLWSNEHSIKEIAKLTNFDYKVIMDNHFSYFLKKRYLDKKSKGRYIINQEGLLKIEYDLNYLKANQIILNLSKEKFTNHQIKKVIKKRLDLDFTDSSLFSKISRLRKLYKVENRRIKRIKIKEDKFFFEFLGLILSDGHIAKYFVGFYNKDSSLISYYLNLVRNKWGQKVYIMKTKVGTTAISLYSKELSKYVNSFLYNKNKLSDKILKNKRINQNYFLRGLYSGDGSITLIINKRKTSSVWRIEFRVNLAVFNENIMHDIVQLLKDKGYQPSKDQDSIFLNRVGDVKKFYKEIGFIKGGKIRKSKNLKRIEKNKLLAYLVNRLSKDRKMLQKYTKKKEILKYIRKQVT